MYASHGKSCASSGLLSQPEAIQPYQKVLEQKLQNREIPCETPARKQLGPRGLGALSPTPEYDLLTLPSTPEQARATRPKVHMSTVRGRSTAQTRGSKRIATVSKLRRTGLSQTSPQICGSIEAMSQSRSYTIGRDPIEYGTYSASCNRIARKRATMPRTSPPSKPRSDGITVGTLDLNIIITRR